MKLRTLAACVALTACGADAPHAARVAASIIVEAPHSNATVTSPLHVVGIAPSDWFAGSAFLVQLVDEHGAVLAEAPATARADWSVAAPVRFSAILNFDVPAETSATLVFTEATETSAPREMRLPIRLVQQPALASGGE